MSIWTRVDPHGYWRAAIITGLVSGTFSTIIVTLGAARIGRDAAVDWMQIATAYFGDRMITEQPTWLAIAGGLVVHQTADLGWAVAFFGLLGRWTHKLSPSSILLFGLPWALATAAIEYWVILPWLQPIVPMQVPYWTAAMVHVTSAAAYPVFYWARSWLVADAPYVGFGRRWAGLLLAPLVALSILALLARQDYEPRWPLARAEGRMSDQRFLRLMTTHHQVGAEMSQLAADRATELDVRMLGKLMTAGQKAEIEVMQNWWGRWYGTEMPQVTSDEQREMSGMPTREQLDQLANLEGPEFDQAFIRLMVPHHEGAIMMARETWGGRGDPRIFPLADSIIHAQVRQIDRLERHCNCGKKTAGQGE